MTEKQEPDHNIPTKPMQLTEEVKAQIRAEEVYREEVRPKPPGRFWWLNQPFVIFVLSTFVVGGISFLYTKYSEKRADLEASRELNDKKVTAGRFEISFRASQVDELLMNAVEASHEVSKMSDEEFRNLFSQRKLSSSGEKLVRLFRSAPPLKVVADLGGIGSPPKLGEDPTVRIGSSGYGHRHIPHERGYRLDEFKNYSLEELLELYWQVAPSEAPGKGDVLESKQVFAKFNEATKINSAIETITSIHDSYTLQKWYKASTQENVKTTTDDVVRWVNSVATAWQGIKVLLPERNP